MPARKLDPALAAAIKRMAEQGVSTREIAEKLGVSAGTACNYSRGINRPRSLVSEDLKKINTPIDNRGPNGGETSILSPDKPKSVEEMAVLFKIDLKEWQAESIRTNEWQGFYKLKHKVGVLSETTGHQKVCLWQTRVTWKRIVTGAIEKGIAAFVASRVPEAEPLKLRTHFAAGIDDPEYLVTWGLWDAHLGMFAWAPETGENFDLKMATNRVMNSIDDMVIELSGYRISKVLMPVGNDFMHFDTARQTTTGGTPLDTDNRFAKVYEACLRCLCHMVERALEITDKVEVLYIPGNHDQISSYTLCVALKQRYRNEPRVEVDASACPRKHRTHGGTLLAFDHGQEATAGQLAQIFSLECKDLWSKSTYREVQIGHTHQRRARSFEDVTPTNGVLVRTNPSLCNVDAWHHKQGLIGEPMKSVEACRYDKTGFRGSHVTWARDNHNPASKKPLHD